LTVTFEVWNRQKYPVGLKFLFVTFRNERADFDADHAGWMMYDAGRKLAREVGEVIQPESHKPFSFTATFKAITGKEYRDRYKLVAEYFDPRANKTKVTGIEQQVDMRHLF
jgi:hypothetical protein